MPLSNWSTSTLGTFDRWPQNLRTAVNICLECQTPIILALGPELIVICNDACTAVLGDPPTATLGPVTLGPVAREARPELWAAIGPALESVLGGRPAAQTRDLVLMTNRNGFCEEAFFSFSYAPVRDEKGVVGGVLTQVTETTKEVVRQRRLGLLASLSSVTADTEDEAIGRCLHLLQANGADVPAVLLYRLDAENQRAVLRGAAGIAAGAPAAPDTVELGDGPLPFAEVAKGWSGLVRNLPPSVADALRSPWNDLVQAALMAPIAPGSAQEFHGAIVVAASPRQMLDTEYEDFLRLVAGHVGAVVGRARSAEQQRERDETGTLEILHRVGSALADNLDLERIVQTVTDAATSLAGAQFGAFFYNALDDKGGADTLYAVSGVARDSFAKFLTPANSALLETTFQRRGVIRSADIRRDARLAQDAPELEMPDRRAPVVSYLAVPVVSRSGEVLGGLCFGHERAGMFTTRTEQIIAGIAAQAAIAIDNANLFRAAQTELAERRRVEQHQELLLAELNHRVKNTLAIVLSIATQTLRHADTAEIFRAGFEARIMALAEAHNLLTDGNWEGASLRAILERVLGPYRAEGKQRYHLETDSDVRLGPQTAVAMVMAYSELATNAAKYGALSSDSGSVKVAWSVERGEKPPRLRVKWEEIGGPRVKEPGRSGFGSRLIRGLSHDASGKVDMRFLESGLVCMFDLPLTTGDRA